MYSKRRAKITSLSVKLLALYMAASAVSSHADSSSSTLTVKPSRCIALQKGQTCYATLSFNWTTPADGEYCLFDEHMEKPMICWTGNTLLAYNHEFKSKKNVNYHIRLRQGQLSISSTLVKISWVYKPNTKNTSRWRLF